MTARGLLRRRRARVAFAAVALFAVLAPLATLFVAGAAGAVPPAAGPSVEEAAVALGGAQRLLLASAATRTEPAALADDLAAARGPQAPGASLRAHAGGTRGASAATPLAAAESRRL